MPQQLHVASLPRSSHHITKFVHLKERCVNGSCTMISNNVSGDLTCSMSSECIYPGSETQCCYACQSTERDQEISLGRLMEDDIASFKLCLYELQLLLRNV